MIDLRPALVLATSTIDLGALDWQLIGNLAVSIGTLIVAGLALRVAQAERASPKGRRFTQKCSKRIQNSPCRWSAWSARRIPWSE